MPKNTSTKSNQLAEQKIKLSNVLIYGAHNLKLAEKRIVYVCLAKLESVSLIDGRYKFTITAKEYADTFEIDLATAYDQLKSAKGLMRKIARTIEITPEGKKEHSYVWVSGVLYHHGEGWIEVGFSPEMTPHLFELRACNGFTSYQLKQTTALRSIYSWRLFELMMRFKDKGLLRMSIEDFYYAMEVPLSCQRDFFNLKKRVVEPAVKELCTKNNMLIEWEVSKKCGKKITGLEFRFKQNPQTLLPI